MNKGELESILLDGQSSEQFIAAVILGLIGLLGSIFLQLFKSKKKIKESGGFRLGTWIKDNFARVSLSLLIIIIGAAKGKLVTDHFGDWGPIGLGFMTDKVIESLSKLKGSFNLFSKKA
jgi:hypothetical protein